MVQFIWTIDKEEDSGLKISKSPSSKRIERLKMYSKALWVPLTSRSSLILPLVRAFFPWQWSFGFWLCKNATSRCDMEPRVIRQDYNVKLPALILPPLVRRLGHYSNRWTVFNSNQCCDYSYRQHLILSDLERQTRKPRQGSWVVSKSAESRVQASGLTEEQFCVSYGLFWIRMSSDTLYYR
jgi:hypothetical protein